MATINRAFDEETLALVKAFYRIADPDIRKTILALAEAAANGASVNVTTFAGANASRLS